MIIYCDTSFLISWLNDQDSNYKKARDASAKWDAHDFVLCEAQFIEFPAAVRAAIHRSESAIPAHIARGLINRFDRALNSGMLLRKSVNMSDCVAMARTLGDTHGWRERHTAFDLWHLAAAWSLSAGVFLTFDERQGSVARMLGMRT